MNSLKPFSILKWDEVALQHIQSGHKWSLVGGPFGSKLGQRDYADSGVPVIRGINLSGEGRFISEDFVFVSEDKADELLSNNAYPGDLVFTQRGTLGQIGIIPKDSMYPRFVISQSQMKLTVDESKAIPEYIYHYFRSRLAQKILQNYAIVSGVPHINLEILRAFRLKLPPLLTQRKIASILSAYDDLIENNNRRIKILEEMAQAIYKEWFVHFRFPGYENVPMVESQLGKIPQGWEVKRLGDVLELAYGKALRASDRKEGGYPVYGSGGIVGHHNKALVAGPGIIVGRKGNVGSVYWSDYDFFPIDTVFYVKSPESLHLLYYTLKSQQFVDTDTAVPGLNRNSAYRVPVIRPGKATVDEFQLTANPMFNQLKGLRERNQNLRKTRDLLLPRLISGRLNVEDLDIAM